MDGARPGCFTGRLPRSSGHGRTIAVLALSVLICAALLHAAEPLKELRLDFATYSPSSLMLKKFGWLEEDFKKDGTAVKWVFSAGSNRALEYLNAGSLDIGSSAGLAALLGKAGRAATSRNWATVTKLMALLRDSVEEKPVSQLK